MVIFDKYKIKKEKKDFIREIIAKLGCNCWMIEEKDVNAVMTRYYQTLIKGKRRLYTAYHHPFREDVAFLREIGSKEIDWQINIL